MTLLILTGLAVAWALVLRPVRKPERSPFGGLPGGGFSSGGFSGRLRRSSKKRERYLGQFGELGYHGVAGHYGRLGQHGEPASGEPGSGMPGSGVRIAGSANQSPTMRPPAVPPKAMRPLPPVHRGIQPFSRGGNQPFSRGGNPANNRRPSQRGFAPPFVKSSPLSTTRPPSVRGAIPVSAAEAALRRRDITVILATAALVTLVALFITQQVWLGVLHLLFDVVLFGYLWLVTRRLHLYTGNWSSSR